jgi:hypothetical protein
VVATSLPLLLGGCQFPQDIDLVEVHNTIEPSATDSGGTVRWRIDVENFFDEDLLIERCTASELATGGWAVGLYEYQDELSITNTLIATGISETIYEKAKPVANSGPNEIEITNTVTVYTDKGVFTGTCAYHILPK